MSTTTLFQPDYAVHPGETLTETLEELGMSQAELAQRMGRPLQMISEIVQGKKAITAETAFQLERATGVPANFWNSAQRNYEAAAARLAEDRDLAPDSAWLDRFPLRALIKLGHIPRPARPRANAGPAQLLWRRRQEGMGEHLDRPGGSLPQIHRLRGQPHGGGCVAPSGRAPRATGAHRALRPRPLHPVAPRNPQAHPSRASRVRTQAAENSVGSPGVAFVLVPELPATRVHGATRWLTPQKALLQLSLRGKTDDFLWFAFFHEAAHILKHGKREVFIEGPDRTADEDTKHKEQEADTFASDFLISKTAFAELLQRRPFTTEKVKRFAAELGIPPASWLADFSTRSLSPSPTSTRSSVTFA